MEQRYRSQIIKKFTKVSRLNAAWRETKVQLAISDNIKGRLFKPFQIATHVKWPHENAHNIRVVYILWFNAEIFDKRYTQLSDTKVGQLSARIKANAGQISKKLQGKNIFLLWFPISSAEIQDERTERKRLRVGTSVIAYACLVSDTFSLQQDIQCRAPYVSRSAVKIFPKLWKQNGHSWNIKGHLSARMPLKFPNFGKSWEHKGHGTVFNSDYVFSWIDADNRYSFLAN